MPCGQYEEMAREMGIDCEQFTDEEKAKMLSEIEALVADGRDPEDAIRDVTSRRVNASGLPDTVDGFVAEWTPKGHLVMKDVPVFLPTEKKGRKFNKAWMEGALADGKTGEADGYLPPMHVKHHSKEGEKVIPAGMFRMKEIQPRMFKGKEHPMLLVDKIFTNPDVIEDVLADRLPYRSVEIFDADLEKIDGLALLDDEAPFLELPITHARVTGEQAEDATETVAPATFSRDWALVGCEADSPFVACFSRGKATQFLMEKPMGTLYTPVQFQKDPEEEQAEMVEETPETAPEAGDTAPPAEDEGTPNEPPVEEGGETPEEIPTGDEPAAGDPELGAPEDNISGAVEGIVGMIMSGKISVADLHAIQEAISTVEGAAHGEEPPMAEEKEREEVKETVQKDVEASPPPLASPGEAMQRDQPETPSEEEVPGSDQPETTEPAPQTSEREAVLMGRVDGLEARLAERDEKDAIREAVDEAMEALEGRALGHEPRERFTAFARTHGVPAFKAYAEELAKELPPVSASRFESDPDAFDFGKSLPDEVLVFQKDGPAAVEAATKHAAMYDMLKEKGMVNVDLARYLDIQMHGLTGAQ